MGNISNRMLKAPTGSLIGTMMGPPSGKPIAPGTGGSAQGIRAVSAGIIAMSLGTNSLTEYLRATWGLCKSFDMKVPER